MLELAQVALHDHTVVILAIGLVTGGEVFLYRYEPVADGLCRHSNSILLGDCVRNAEAGLAATSNEAAAAKFTCDG
jgi:hypothetical protein